VAHRLCSPLGPQPLTEGSTQTLYQNWRRFHASTIFISPLLLPLQRQRLISNAFSVLEVHVFVRNFNPTCTSNREHNSFNSFCKGRQKYCFFSCSKRELPSFSQSVSLIRSTQHFTTPSFSKSQPAMKAVYLFQQFGTYFAVQARTICIYRRLKDEGACAISWGNS
jgi:hypothetical protein